MESYDIYKDIADRTDGDIYIGVVGPVRAGKSTFITKFMQTSVIPNISGNSKRQIAIDEMPQSAGGKTVMTTEPKFVPGEAVTIDVGNGELAKVRLIDCVGYMIDGALGGEENGEERKVKTPWSDTEIPFSEAAELGTRKVIKEHSTIGVLVTTDGSITEIPRASYVKAEERVVKELKEINKPFIIVLNCKNAKSKETVELKQKLELKYGVTVVAVNVLESTQADLNGIIEKVLLEFPMRRIDVDLPDWICALPSSSNTVSKILDAIKEGSKSVSKMKDYENFEKCFDGIKGMTAPNGAKLTLGDGHAEFDVGASKELFYEVLADECGEDIKDEFTLMKYVKDLKKAKECYHRIKDALSEVDENGYGIVKPLKEDVVLKEPEIVKQGGRYSVKIHAEAESLHLMRVDVKADVVPITGSEKQCKDFIEYINLNQDDGIDSVMNTDVFGRPLGVMVGDEIRVKTDSMTMNVRSKLRRTATRCTNDGKNNLFCVLL